MNRTQQRQHLRDQLRLAINTAVSPSGAEVAVPLHTRPGYYQRSKLGLNRVDLIPAYKVTAPIRRAYA